MTLRYLTAGESHGPALVGILEGLPAGVPVDLDAIAHQLERRRAGHGRSPRMKFEADEFQVLAGVRHGLTIGSPVALVIHNTEWPKWTEAMAVEAPEDPEAVAQTGRGRPLTRPRPGHADLVGMQKYGYDEVRNVLERASARETATRVGLAAVARGLLDQLGISVLSHVVRIGEVAVPEDAPPPGPGEQERVDDDPVRCAEGATSERMQERIDRAKGERDTLGGVVEVVAYGVPVGLGSHVHWDRKLDGRLAQALMSIQAFKGVEVGEGFRTAEVPGSKAHDEIVASEGDYRRLTSRSGGLEGGITTGEPLRVRAAMKPLSSLTQPLRTVDVETGEEAQAITQRSDVCAVPRAGVVAEAIVALELADALLEKTGGDSLDEVRRNLEAFLGSLPRAAEPSANARAAEPSADDRAAERPADDRAAERPADDPA
ncbi:chorismate synthase [Egibacter rhizosphaerae]|uniref:Chorismate synthase n=1 Tax=Egibacter rhizosphaerae TaxID=1670831 RepID=A0A411YK02_9ACTN|nr:chorismate synthase [Egibacter rhizosphaerae]QBI21526.1 chorismate synthase [Egibacter rhizosphaerae]